MLGNAMGPGLDTSVFVAFTSTAIAGGDIEDIAISVVSAGLTYGIGHGGKGGATLFKSAGATTVAHGVVQGLASTRRGNFIHGFLAGTTGHLVGNAIDGTGNIITRTAIASTAGGFVSKAAGGDFSAGAMSAAFVHLFNNEMTPKKDHYLAFATKKEMQRWNGLDDNQFYAEIYIIGYTGGKSTDEISIQRYWINSSLLSINLSGIINTHAPGTVDVAANASSLAASASKASGVFSWLGSFFDVFTFSRAISPYIFERHYTFSYGCSDSCAVSGYSYDD